MTSNTLPSWRRWLALVTIVAQALLLTAPLWHHHERDECDAGHHDDHCAVCVAAAAERPDPAPPLLPTLFDAPLIGALESVPTAHPALAMILAAHPRGPPMV